MAEDIGDRLRPLLEPLLEPGEELRGVLVATQQSAFRGRMVGIGVTDRRPLLQPLTRKLKPAEARLSLKPDQLAEARASGAGEGWLNLAAAVMDGAAVTLRLRTTGGEKVKLMMMRGSGVLGKLGGGETQRRGVETLADWFAAVDSP